MVNRQYSPSSPQLAWLSGICCCAVVCLLVYQSQQSIRVAVYIPQPTGFLDNWQQILTIQNGRNTSHWLGSLLALPFWFGFQWLNVLIMAWGFLLAFDQHHRSLEAAAVLRRSLLSLLWPFWSVIWLGLPVLWTLEIARLIQPFPSWGLIASGLFPLTFDFSGRSLDSVIHVGWFLPTLVSLTLLFPLIWQLMKQWGVANLLLVSLLLTISYRLAATYLWNAYPTYVMPVTAIVGNGQPFALFFARLAPFVLGVIAGRTYARGKGPYYWSWGKSLLIGGVFYSLGFICQFYRWGWAIDEILIAVGIGLISLVGFRLLCRVGLLRSACLWGGAYAYTGFLLQGLVLDHFGEKLYAIASNQWLWILSIALVTLLLSFLVSYLSPYLQRLIRAIGRDLQYVLTQAPPHQQRVWRPQVGDRVTYQDQPGWIVLKVESLLDERQFLLCKVSNGERSLWVNEDDLELEIGSFPKPVFRSNSA